jgi:hypothetical protein
VRLFQLSFAALIASLLFVLSTLVFAIMRKDIWDKSLLAACVSFALFAAAGKADEIGLGFSSGVLDYLAVTKELAFMLFMTSFVGLAVTVISRKESALRQWVVIILISLPTGFGISAIIEHKSIFYFIERFFAPVFVMSLLGFLLAAIRRKPTRDKWYLGFASAFTIVNVADAIMLYPKKDSYTHIVLVVFMAAVSGLYYYHWQKEKRNSTI